MNHIYKIIFNKSTGKMVVASELAKSQGKTSTTVGSSASQYRYVAFALSLTALSVVPLMSQQAYAATGQAGQISTVRPALEALSLATPGNPQLTAANLIGTKHGTGSEVNNSGGTAIGSQASATLGSTAVGAGARGYGWSSVAVGLTSYAGGEYSVAIGRHTTTQAQRSLALGVAASTTQNADGGIAIGHSVQASGLRAIAIGSADTSNRDFSMENNTKAQGSDSIALGSEAWSKQKDSIAIGHDATAGGEKSIAIGTGAVVNAASSGAFGSALLPTNVNKVDGKGSFSIGNNNTISSNNTVVLGSSITNTHNNSVFLGNNAAYVAQNTTTGGMDNLTQPATASKNQTTLNFGSYAATNPAGVVSVGHATNGQRRIQNVAAGLISATSTDAINGSQLHSTNQVLANVADSIKKVFGNGANVSNDGTISFGSDIGGTNKKTLDEAIKAAAGTGGAVKSVTVQGTDEIKVADQNGNYTISLEPAFKQSVEAAKNEATQAKGQAAQAQQTAQAATQKATQVEGVATQAKQQAEQAKAQAQTAEQKAGQAETKAGAADTKATQAQQQAELAKNVADAAQTTAGKALAEANKSARVFEGDNKNVQVHPANDKITIVGGAQAIADTDLTNNNIAVIGENQGVLKIKLAKTLTGLESITTNMLDTKGTVKIGGLLNANGGIKVAPSQQVDMGGNAIINVGKGTKNNHAVNKQQLEETIDTKLKGFQVGGGQVIVDSTVTPNGKNAVSGEAVDKAIKANKSTIAGTNNEIKVTPQNDSVNGTTYTVGLEQQVKNDIAGAKKDATDAKAVATTANQAATTAQNTAGQALNLANSSAKTFKGDNVGTTVTPANGLINIKGGVADTQNGLTNNNIGVIGEQTGVLTIKLAKTLTGLDSITTNAITVNNSATISGMLNANGGLTVGASKTVDMGNNRITKVAQATEDTDAVNKKQLDETITKRLQGVQTGGTPITIDQEVKPQSQNAVSGAAVDKAIKANKTTVAGTNGEIKVTQNQAADGTTYTIGLGDTAKGDIDQAKTDAGQAKADAGQALTKANQADGKADQALQKANDSVREIQGDNQNTSVKPANGKMTIMGGAADTTDVGLSNNNIGVVGKGNGILEVKLAKNLQGLDGVNTKTLTTTDKATLGGDTDIGGDGKKLTVKPKTTVDMGNNVITNVGKGTEVGHAVNKGQMDEELAKATKGQGDNLKDLLGGGAQVDPQGKVTSANIGGTNQGTINGAIDAVRQTANSAARQFQGDNQQVTVTPANGKITITGGAADTAQLTNNNIGVIGKSAGGQLEIKLAQDIKLGANGSLTTGDENGNKAVQTAKGLTVVDKGSNQQAVYDATGVKFQTPANGQNTQATPIADSVVITKDGLGFAPQANTQPAPQDGLSATAPKITKDGINAGGKAVDNVGSAFDVAPATTTPQGTQKTNVLTDNIAKLANAQGKDKADAQNAIIDALKNAAKTQGGNNKAINAADLGAATTAIDGKLDDAKKALQDSGFYVKTPADATAQGHKITNGNTLSFNNGSNIEITRQDGELTIKTADAPNFSGTVTAGNLASSGSLTVGGDSTLKGNTTVNKNLTVDGDLIAKGGATLGGAGKTVQFAQGTTVDLGGNALTNVGAGTKDTDAVNFKQFTDFRTTIDKIIGEKKDQQGNLVVSDGQGNKPTDKDGKEIVVTPDEALRTYDAQSTSTVETNSIFTAIKNINEQGTKYIHVNGGESSLGGKRGTDPDQSQANGDKSTAIGFQTIAEGKSAVAVGNIAKALGEQALAIGDNAQATGKQSIAIGTGNVVTGQHSGAIGDPTVVTGNNSYSLGNNNRIATNDTYALGSDIIATAENSVALGNKTAVTAGDRSTKALKADGTAGNTTTAGSTGQVKSISLAGTNYEFAGQTAVGAVSVGASGSERRIQNVAAGEVSATSTDAVNGSQLFALAQGIGKQVDGMLGKANAGISSAMAMASMPQAYLAGKSMLTGGMATYNGEAAVAVGLSRLSDNGRWAVKISGSADTRGNAGGSIGAGFHF